MSVMSDFLESQILTHLLGTGSWTKPSTLALALATSPITDSDTSLSGKEVANANGYARVIAGPSDTVWAEGTQGGYTTRYNVSTIAFPQATGSWGTVVDLALCNSAQHNGGNVLMRATVTPNVTVSSGIILLFDAGQIVWGID